MKLPRKGILIRLGIYLPIIGYLAWQAFFPKDKPLPPPPEAPQKEFKVIEMTKEEALAAGFEIPEEPPEAPAEAGAEAAPNDPQ